MVRETDEWLLFNKAHNADAKPSRTATSLPDRSSSGRVVGNSESAGINRQVVGHARALQVENLPPSCWSPHGFDAVAKAAEFADHFVSAPSS